MSGELIVPTGPEPACQPHLLVDGASAQGAIERVYQRRVVHQGGQLLISSRSSEHVIGQLYALTRIDTGQLDFGETDGTETSALDGVDTYGHRVGRDRGQIDVQAFRQAGRSRHDSPPESTTVTRATLRRPEPGSSGTSRSRGRWT